MTDSIGQLRERMAALMDLRTINQLLEWDQQTMMPPRGVQTRAESLATLQRIRHEMFVSDEVGRLLDAADAEINGQGPDSDDAALVRVTRRQWEKARRVPSRARSRARARVIGRAEGMGRGPGQLGFRLVHAQPRAQLRARAPLCRLL